MNELFVGSEKQGIGRKRRQRNERHSSRKQGRVWSYVSAFLSRSRQPGTRGSRPCEPDHKWCDDADRSTVRWPPIWRVPAWAEHLEQLSYQSLLEYLKRMTHRPPHHIQPEHSRRPLLAAARWPRALSWACASAPPQSQSARPCPGTEHSCAQRQHRARCCVPPWLWISHFFPR